MDFNESNLAWNKSFSAPDISRTGPLFRRVIIEESYFLQRDHQVTKFSARASSPSPLSPSSTRHFSCEQLTNLNSKPQTQTDCNFQSTHATLSSTPARVLERDQQPFDSQDSPMDVDQCSSTNIDAMAAARSETAATILDHIDLTFRGSTPILKKRRSKPSNRRSHTTSMDKGAKSRNWFKFNVAIVTLLIIAVPIYDKLNYNRTIDIDGISNDLSSRVVGQKDAVMHLNNALYKFSNDSTRSNPQRHLLVLIGTTGVGKSLCVNLIKRKFMPKQTHEIDIDKFDFDEDFLNLYKSVPYLIIVDDLVYEKMPLVLKFIEQLPKDKWILVITVFNVQETDDVKNFSINYDLYDTIPQAMAQLSFNFTAVKFQSFDLDMIQSNNFVDFYKVYSDFVTRIPDWQHVIRKHNFKTLGFKGLLEKMNLANK